MRFDFGVAGQLGAYNPAKQYCRNEGVEKSDNTSFSEIAAAKASGRIAGTSFMDAWQERFPGSYYHVMDGTKISQEIWNRNDFPFEKFFSNHVDASILDWRLSGAEPSDYDSAVIARRSSVAGKKAFIVHPALEEKMKRNPELAEKVMRNTEKWMAEYPAEPGCSYLVELNENGEISKFCVTGPLRISHSVTETGREKVERLHEKYERLAAENAVKRKIESRLENILMYKAAK